jgi:hypothetical protein
MLRQIFTLILAAGALLTSTLQAQNGPKPLTNDDVVAMVKGGLGESTVISAIGSQDTNFDISATALLQLLAAASDGAILAVQFGVSPFPLAP